MSVRQSISISIMKKRSGLLFSDLLIKNRTSFHNILFNSIIHYASNINYYLSVLILSIFSLFFSSFI